ncbi:flagellar hook-associated protein FlgL [Porticoccaceae bacterium]|nr:flagellar hook-associated protein FlgL [Porticoccaceae bacterium]
MKVSTSQIFERAMTQMSTQQAKVSDLQTQLATGKQIVRPSDDPDKAGIIQRLNSASNRLEGYSDNLRAVGSRLDTEEAALMTSEKVLQRIRELAVKANSETLSQEDRQITAKEIQALRDQMLSLANSRDSAQNYVFAGSMTRTEPFAEDTTGVIAYQGDDNRVMVDVSDQRQLALNRPGSEAFSSIIRVNTSGESERVGFFSALDDLVAALNSNDSELVNRGLAEVSDLTQSMALSIADVGSRMSIAETQVDALNETKIRYESMLSEAQDLDYAAAITKLTAEIMSLEAGQSSFVKISQLSLFDYIR